ncbi:hypothetical protein ACLOJK_038290 [Asimina triloba]
MGRFGCSDRASSIGGLPDPGKTPLLPGESMVVDGSASLDLDELLAAVDFTTLDLPPA